MADGKIKNLALISHAHAGKTSLAEAILHSAKAIDRLGSVDNGSSVSDYHCDEKERQISINSSILHINYKNKIINLIDAPGYADFIGEAVGALSAADNALVVVCAVNGVEVGTSRIWKMAKAQNKPCVIFVNKLDKENSDFEETLNNIKEVLDDKARAFSYPVGKEASFKEVINLLDKSQIEKLADEDKEKATKMRQGIIESAVETDDALMEKYLEGQELSDEEVNKAILKAILEQKITPVLCGSAVKNIGVDVLIDVIADYIPSSGSFAPIEAINPDNPEEEVKVERKKDKPFAAQAFKAISDPYVGQLTVFRVYAGSLKSDTGFYNTSSGTRERIGHLYKLQGKDQVQVDTAQEGDIVAVAKLKETNTSDTLCDEKTPVKFKDISYPEPVISFSVKPKSRSDEEKISQALHKLVAEDPTFKISRNEQTKEEIISGMGNLHLEIMIARLKDNFGVEVEIGTPKVAYKSTITSKAKAQGKYKKQSGGRGQYGDCWIEIEPLEGGEGFEFVNAIVGGAIPRNYIPAVEKGIKKTMEKGVIAGCPMSGLKVTVYDGSFHTVDSSDMAFQIAGGMALKSAAAKAKPVLLEPIMEADITVPEDYMGQINGDISSRRGRIMGMEARGGMETVKAQVPLSEMFKYASELRSMTQGKGSYSMKFSHYEQLPQKLAQAIIEKHEQEKAES
jgi:elongation factor G